MVESRGGRVRGGRVEVEVLITRHVDNALSDVSIDVHVSLMAVPFRVKPKAAVDDGAVAVQLSMISNAQLDN